MFIWTRIDGARVPTHPSRYHNVLPVTAFGLCIAFPSFAFLSNEHRGWPCDYRVEDRQENTGLNAADETRYLLPPSPSAHGFSPSSDVSCVAFRLPRNAQCNLPQLSGKSRAV